MRLSIKHTNQQSVTYTDFSGGLNTSVAQEMIAQNELAVCLNMDVDTATGRLKTVDGCEVVYRPDLSLRAVLYDKINRVFLLVDDAQAVYSCDLAAEEITHKKIGTLSGNLFPVYASWEDGILIASGGHLQYFNGNTLKEIAKSPKVCSFVYTKSGRILVNDQTKGDESNLYFSAVGDEEDWSDDSNVDSSSKWVEVGYKDGGKIIAFVAMGQDIIIIKDNRCVYRLSGDYPNWAIYEVSRNLDCSGRLAFYNEGENLYVLGKNEIQYLQSAAFYGDIKASNIATKVTDKIQSVVTNPRMIYIPILNQVWIPLEQRYVLVYDCTLRSFYMRRFNDEDIVDVVNVNKETFIVRPSSICRLKPRWGYDNGKKIMWRFVAKRLVSHNDFLLKRATVNITPYFDTLIEGNFKIGGIMLPLPQPYVSFRLWHNFSRVYHNRHHVCGENQRFYNLYDTGFDVYENYEPVFHNYQPVYNTAAIAVGERGVFRNKSITISGSGSGCSFLVNEITLDIAEV